MQKFGLAGGRVSDRGCGAAYFKDVHTLHAAIYKWMDQ